jgi:CubicO group peptidase (beta-lactamase class C family)
MSPGERSPRILDDAGVASSLDLLSAWIEAQMAYGGVPGLSIGIVHDQALLWARGFGLASLESGRPATPETVYRIASITKLFTSTAILQLRDAGRLRLDDAVVDHLPWFAIKQAHQEAPTISIRHLLTHTAGLPREAGFPYWTDGSFPTREELRERVSMQETVFPTETEWKYSNLGLTLAGEIVAAASGLPWERYVSERILAPLGMQRTWVSTPPADHSDLATGYTRRLPSGGRSPAPFTDGRALAPAANMATSVSDLARFAALQFGDGRVGGIQILRASTLREMHRVHWLEPEWTAGWGLGFRVTRENGKTFVGHSGRLRGYRTMLHLSPADRIGAIVMINADDGNPPLFAEKVFRWVVAEILRVVAPPARVAPEASWRRYVGKYRSPWADTQVLVVDGRLALVDPSQPDPLQAATHLHPVGEHTFRMSSSDGYSSRGELVVFEMDEEGRVARVKLGENYTLPVTEW